LRELADRAVQRRVFRRGQRLVARLRRRRPAV